MATGSGTGTPASAASSATLATLRARVLTQVTGANQGTDWTPVAASALTLATMRDRVELVLQDSSNATWATGDIDEAIDQALEQYSRHRPDHAISSLTLAADGRVVRRSIGDCGVAFVFAIVIEEGVGLEVVLIGAVLEVGDG